MDLRECLQLFDKIIDKTNDISLQCYIPISIYNAVDDGMQINHKVFIDMEQTFHKIKNAKSNIKKNIIAVTNSYGYIYAICIPNSLNFQGNIYACVRQKELIDFKKLVLENLSDERYLKLLIKEFKARIDQYNQDY